MNLKTRNLKIKIARVVYYMVAAKRVCKYICVNLNPFLRNQFTWQNWRSSRSSKREG